MIYQGRYVVDEPLVDGAFRLCALYERQLPTPEETADEICADWHMHAAFHLLADHGGPLDPDAPRLPGRGTQVERILRASEGGDRGTMRAILRARVQVVFPHLCPRCRAETAGPDQN